MKKESINKLKSIVESAIINEDEEQFIWLSDFFDKQAKSINELKTILAKADELEKTANCNHEWGEIEGSNEYEYQCYKCLALK